MTMVQAALPLGLRGSLKSAVQKGHEVALAAAEEALAPYGVVSPKAPEHLDESGRRLRNRLRAHARQLGGASATLGAREMQHLVEEVAYEQWHRILFSRFLLENQLLIHPEFETPVSLDFLEELARDEGRDPWELAGDYASRMLPQIFRPGDSTQELRLPLNRVQELEREVLGLDAAVFKARDSLGWAYQFWQTQRKDDIDNSGVKVGRDEIAPATQLFTEDYMVEFLLHNTLGAWWLAHHGDKPLPVDMPYLRQQARTSSDDEAEAVSAAAGNLEGWPSSLKDLKTLDPCCGSGHFSVFLLHLLVPMRMVLEDLSPAEAVDAVLRENIHALEIDLRCVEIAVFALALAAWTYPGAGGYRPLPRLHVACCGLPISQKESEWLALANGDSRLREGMHALYGAFKDAPLLGSLVNPRATEGSLLSADFDELEPLLSAVLAKERVRASEEATEAVLTARDLLDGARLLSGRYHLVATNVPYLTRGKHNDELKAFCERHYSAARHDLATVFIERCHALCDDKGVLCLVSPQNWWFLKSYAEFRRWLLGSTTLKLAAALGEEAWEYYGDRGPLATLLVAVRGAPPSDSSFQGFDAVSHHALEDKKLALRHGPIRVLRQAVQLQNPDARIVLAEEGASRVLLQQYASGLQGVSTSDNPRFRQHFWEQSTRPEGWTWFQSSPATSSHFDGCSTVVWMAKLNELLGLSTPDAAGQSDSDGAGAASRDSGVYLRGKVAWGRSGVAIRQMRELSTSLYCGAPFDTNTAIVLPKNPEDLPAIWCFCRSDEYTRLIRSIDLKVNVTNATLVKVPFDLAHWKQVASEQYPRGLPEPYSNDPTQWMFHGHPFGTVEWDSERKQVVNGTSLRQQHTLQIAVARLLGYRWPAEYDTEVRPSQATRGWALRSAELARFADGDGIVCIPSVKGERAAADRLLDLLAASCGDAWRPALLDKLLADAGHAGKSLEDWLRSGFFAQHCKLFDNCPFIWHIWDGEREGFSALVNYHKLDKRLLQALAFTYLGSWIEEQKRQQAAGIKGAKQLVDSAVALQDKLKAILEGESPCDIFIRWKPLAAQPLGWDPDPNDGVTMNIRPFMLSGDVGKKGAGVLRDKPGIDWKKDRGADATSAPWYSLGPTYGEAVGVRINEHHTSLAEKKKARGGR